MKLFARLTIFFVVALLDETGAGQPTAVTSPNVERYMQGAQELVDAGEFDQAINEYNALLQLKPNDDSAYFNRGNTFDKKGDFDHAIADFNEAIRIDPNRSERHTVVYRKR